MLFIIVTALAQPLFSQTDSSVVAQKHPASGETAPKMDTLITFKGTKIAGKITKVTETDIEYKKVLEPDAAIFVISTNKVLEIRWANGTRELIVADEMDVNTASQVIDKRQAVKFDFFSPANDQIRFLYEHSIKVGINLEVGASLINNSMFRSSFNSGKYLIQGATVSMGAKFLLGQNYFVKGLKYIHPLSGRFVKPEIAFSNFNIRGLQVFVPYTVGGYPNYKRVKTDKQISSVAFMINYGRQFILANVLTLSLSGGVGYCYTSAKYSNPDVTDDPNPYSYYNENRLEPLNLYSHFRIKNVPVAYNASVSIGYLFK